VNQNNTSWNRLRDRCVNSSSFGQPHDDASFARASAVANR